MYQLVRSLSVQRLFAQQMPALAASFLIAESFYKFHSFTLECAAFLLTWFTLDGVTQLLLTGLTRVGYDLSARGPRDD